MADVWFIEEREKPGRGKRVELRVYRGRILGAAARVAVVYIRPGTRVGTVRRELAEIAERFRRRGIKPLIHHDFRFKELFPRCEVSAACGELLSHMPLKAALAASQRRENAALAAKRAGKDVLRAAEELARSFRYVTAVLPDGEWEKVYRALAGTGASVRRGTGYVDADVLLVFDPPEDGIAVPDSCAVLDFTEGRHGNITGGRLPERVEFAFGGITERSFLPGYDVLPVIAEAAKSGTYDLRDTAVKLELRKKAKTENNY